MDEDFEYDNFEEDADLHTIAKEHFEVVNKEHKEFLGYLQKETKVDKEILLTLSNYFNSRESRNQLATKEQYTIAEFEERLIGNFLTDMIKRSYDWNKNKELVEINVPCCDGTEICLKSKNLLIDDVKLLCILYATKGSTLVEISAGSCEQMYKMFSVLMEKYNIIYNTVAGNPDFIYLMKIARCFPFTCCELYSRNVRRKQVLNTVLGKPLKHRQTALICPVFPMVASRYLFKTSFNILPHLLWIAHVNFVSSNTSLNVNPKAISLWTSLKRLITASKYLNEKRKFMNCYHWNLIDKKGEPHSIWKETKELCMDYLEKTYSTDDSWENVKQEVFI